MNIFEQATSSPTSSSHIALIPKQWKLLMAAIAVVLLGMFIAYVNILAAATAKKAEKDSSAGAETAEAKKAEEDWLAAEAATARKVLLKYLLPFEWNIIPMISLINSWLQ